MGRRSQASGTNDALELFLDTISNAFGGVIFIALLVCLLLQMSGKGVPPDRRQQQVKAESIRNKLENMQREIDKNNAVEKTLIAQIGQLAKKTDPALAMRYAELSAAKQIEDARYVKIMSQASELHRQIAEMQSALKRFQERKPKLEHQLAQAQEYIEQLKKQNTYRLVVPAVGESNRAQVQIMLEGGRMAFIHKYNDQAKRVKLNTDEIEEGRASSGGETHMTFRLRPGKGTRVTAGDGFANYLKGCMDAFNPSQHNIIVVVWPNSYEEFEIVRDFLIDTEFTKTNHEKPGKPREKMGFGYLPVFLEAGKAVPVGTGGGPGGVFNPR